MTTKYLTIKFRKISKFYCHGISQEKQCFWTIFRKISPSPTPPPPQNANVILILSFRRLWNNVSEAISFCRRAALRIQAEILQRLPRSYLNWNLQKIWWGLHWKSFAVRAPALKSKNSSKKSVVLVKCKHGFTKNATLFSLFPGMRLFAYSWKLPAYNGAFLLTVDNFSAFTYSWSFVTWHLQF